MTTITVSLNTSANPPVTVDQPTLSVGPGLQTITWVPAAGQNFSFTSLTGLPNPPFSQAHVSNGSISISDNNNGPGVQNYYTYTIVVTFNGQQYSTARGADPTLQAAHGPFVHNKPN